MRYIFTVLLSVTLFSCEGQNQKNSNKPAQYDSQFSNYWFQGKAEISSYELNQARYGEMREGDAVLIFVTEDFSESKQVKLDDPFSNQKDAVKVLKLNTTRKFNTGIYPYSMMESVFTPLDYVNYPNTLKVTTSSQEWCGHTFSQINLGTDNYHFSGKSYFESEGDDEIDIKKTLLESELFNLIRLKPSSLPTGDIEIVPSGFFTRLSHLEIASEKAQASLSTNKSGNSVLSIDYSKIERKVEIEYKSEFPYKIIGWREIYKSGFGKNAKTMTTSANIKKTILLDYWSKNGVQDSTYRKTLMLD